VSGNWLEWKPVMTVKGSAMKHVLIVDDEPSLLRSIESGFENQQERFQVLTAANGREALAVLDSQAIDLVITDLRMPVMDGFELLAEMSSRFSHIPNVVMSAFGTPKIEKQLAGLGTFRFLDKPVDFDTMEQCINCALDAIDDEAGSLSGISLANFLQLIEVEGKTCTLFVFSNTHHRGVLHFQSGRLINASSGGLTGNQAVIEMVTWENVKLSLHELTLEPDESAINITSDLMFLLMEGARLKDETEAELDVLIEQGLDLKLVESESVADFHLNPEGGNMAGLKEILKEMASEMDGVLAIQVTGMDGIAIAVHNPAGADVDAFSAKFAMVMKLIEKSVGDLKNLGDFEENLVQTQNAWVLTRFVGAGYYMGIVVSREGTLGNVRLVAGKYQEKLRKSL
jgi:CheY-like chemotaxis protein